MIVIRMVFGKHTVISLPCELLLVLIYQVYNIVHLLAWLVLQKLVSSLAPGSRLFLLFRKRACLDLFALQ